MLEEEQRKLCPTEMLPVLPFDTATVEPGHQASNKQEKIQKNTPAGKLASSWRLSFLFLVTLKQSRALISEL